MSSVTCLLMSAFSSHRLLMVFLFQVIAILDKLKDENKKNVNEDPDGDVGNDDDIDDEGIIYVE